MNDEGTPMSLLGLYIATKATATEQNPWGVKPEIKRGLVKDTSKYSLQKALSLVMEFPELYGSGVIISHTGGEYEASDFTSGDLLARFFERYSASLVFPGFQHRNVLYKSLCLEVEEHTQGLGAFATAFYTPKGKPGLSTHWDMGSVVALQLKGTKHWRVGPPIAKTLEAVRNPRLITAGEEAATGFMEVMLREGDALFVPRGWLHSAGCKDHASIHVSIGIVHRDMQHIKLRAY